MKKFFAERKLNIICSIAAIVFMWLVWIAAYFAVGNKMLVPGFGETMSSFFALFSDGSFWLALLFTLLRTLAAFALSFVAAALCACAAALSKGVRAALKPIIAFVRILPTLAVILLILRWTAGDKNVAPIIVTFLVLFPMIYAQLLASVDGIDTGLKEMAKVYSLSSRDRLFYIYLPAVLPNTLAQTGANISLGLKVMISAEVLAFTLRGLGGRMQYANAGGYVAELAALTLVTVIFGLIIDISVSQLTKITDKWTKKEGIND